MENGEIENGLAGVVKGLVPPHDEKLEQVVLGAMMLEENNIDVVIDLLKPEVFYPPTHQDIFAAIRHLYDRSVPVDLLSVKETLTKNKKLSAIGGTQYLVQLSDMVSASSNLESHVRMLLEKYTRRRLITLSHNIQRKAYAAEEDVFEVLEDSEKGLYGIMDHLIKQEVEPVQTVLPRALKEIENKKADKLGLTGIPSGFQALDELTSGWQNADLIVIAGRPSMGKTAFALSLLRNAAVDFGKPVALFSMEMSSVQIALRLLSSESELESNKIRRGRLEKYEWQQLISRSETLSDAPIFVDESPSLSATELRTKARKLKAKNNISMIVVDYLQLMRGGSNRHFQSNREQEIANISRTLKALAKEMDIPIVVLSQLNREVEKRSGDKRPILSDLRESGSIEQDADLVLFLHRPEHYGLTEDAEGNPTKGMAEIMVAKHRSGPTGNVHLRYLSDITKFAPLDYVDADFEGEIGL